MSRKILVEDRVLMVEDTFGMFMVLGAGVILGILSLTIESIVRYYKKKHMVQDDSNEEHYWKQSCTFDSWMIQEDLYSSRIKRLPSRGSI